MSYNCVEDEYSLTTGLYHRGITMPKEEIADLLRKFDEDGKGQV
jgi:hypothetical protein